MRRNAIWIGSANCRLLSRLTASSIAPNYDFVHAFYVHSSDYQADFDRLKAAIVKNGMIWISWYKKAAKMPTDITEDVVRDVALAGGLVDVKVAAIDAQWSGLKLVYRREDR